MEMLEEGFALGKQKKKSAGVTLSTHRMSKCQPLTHDGLESLRVIGPLGTMRIPGKKKCIKKDGVRRGEKTEINCFCCSNYWSYVGVC